MKAMTSSILSTVLLLGLLGTLRAADVNGRWKSEFQVQDWHLKYTYEFKTEGDKLTGKAFRDRDGEKATVAIQEGKINGDEISFVELVKTGDQDLRIEYTGKVTGDEIKFTRKVGDFGSNEIVAKRDKEGASGAIADAAGKWQSEFDSQVGHQKYLYEFKVDGGKLTGKATREVNEEKTTTDITGKVTGGDISFTEPLKIQDQAITIDYTGKISGDEIKLTRKVEDFATTEIVAKRVKEAGATPKE
ncbi:MAG: hypothetical protein ABSH38_09705 [Verrucomicrobiota bacterium]|jgi:maltodextrin utilization protein YvdJ